MGFSVVYVAGGKVTVAGAGVAGTPAAGVVTVQGVSGGVALTGSNASGSQVDGHSATLGSTGDAATATTVIGRLQKLVSLLPTALVGGRLDVNQGAWLGSTAPTVGQKASAASLPVVIANDQSAVAVSGTVTANIGTTNGLALDATLTGGTQRTKLTDGTNNVSVKAASTPAAASDVALVVAVSPNNTIPISAVALPLPTGASTAAKQPALGTAGTASTDVLTVQGIASMVALKVDGSGVTQPVSGTVTGNQGSANTNANGWPVKNTDGTNVAAVKAASTAAVATDPALVVAVSPNNTVPISAAALPLPTGAATSAKQPALGTAGTASADVLTVQGIASMTALKVDGSAVTQPISAATLPLPTGASTAAKQPALGTAGTASSDVLTVQGIASMVALKVDGSGATQPVSGTVTANIGTTNGLALDATLTGNNQRTRITDGTNLAAVKAASTAPVAADPALVVAISPNSSITASNPSVSATGSAVPSQATMVGASDGTNLQALRIKAASTAAVATDPALVVAISPNNSLTTSPTTATTPSVNNITAANADTQLVASNASRKGLILFNKSNRTMRVKYGSGASQTSNSFELEPDDYWDMPGPIIFTGQVNAWWDSGVSGFARVTETT